MDADKTAVLGEVEERVLIALSGFNNVSIYTWKVAEVSGIGEQLALYHLTELETTGFVQGNGKERDLATWALAQSGRGYLVRRGLLA
jgi:hypothetical protein